MPEEYIASRPTHILKIKARSGTHRSVAGAAWLNDSGAISIQLNPGIVLSYDLYKDFTIMLFPNNYTTKDT